MDNPLSSSIIPKDSSASVDSVTGGNGITVSPTTGAAVVSLAAPVVPVTGLAVGSYNAYDGSSTGWIDDFNSTGSVTVSASTTFQGDTNWSVAPITAGTTGIAAGATPSSTEFLNPGQMILQTPAVSGQGISMIKGGGTNGAAALGFLGANAGWQLDEWFLLPATITNYCLRVGFCRDSQQVADAPNSGIWLEYDTANASSNSHFELRTVNASTSTYTDSGVTPVASTWYHVRIYSTVAGTISFALGAANAVPTVIATNITANVDSTHSMLPMIQILPRTTAAVSVIRDRSQYFASTGRH